MGIRDIFRREPQRDMVIFSGDRIEAGFVINLLKEEGYHPREWADLPAPAYLGPVGMARVVVPEDEAEGARELLASLRESPLTDEIDDDEDEPGDE